jgi:Na+/melibiose symporter-like transporter
MNKALKPYQLIFYGMPGLPMAMLGLPLFVYLPTFYSENLGLSLTSIGFALLFARLLDVITDPLIGILNDRLPIRFWRRKSFMLAGVPLLMLGLHYLLVPQATATAWYLFLWSFITYLGWTLINIPWLTMGAELSPVYHEKSSLVSSREVFAVIGTVIVISLPVIISTQSDLAKTLQIISNLILVLLPISLIPLIWGLPEKKNQTAENVSKQKQSHNKQLASIIVHPAIKKLLPAYFINSFANALPATLFILFVTHIIQTPNQVGVLLICYFLSAVLGLPFWLILARKFDKNKSWGIALLLAIASFIWVPFIGPNDFYPFLLICILTGFALGADVVFPASLQADITQDIANTSASGKQSSGLLFGLWSLLTKLSLALAVGLAFPLLDIFGLKDATANAKGLLALSFLYGLLPVLLKIWVVAQIWNFPFNEAYFERNQMNIKNSPTGENHENHNLTATISRVSSQSHY